MSTPQLEDGHVRIANALLEAILAFGFSQREMLVLLTVIRKTYGFNKKADDMSASQIGALGGVARQHVTTTLNGLAARNVISKSPGEYGMLIGIQKDHRKWIAASQIKAAGSPESGQGCPESGQAEGSSASPESGLVPNQDMSQIGTGGSPESGPVDIPH